jgi:hypothetical protein
MRHGSSLAAVESLNEDLGKAAKRVRPPPSTGIILSSWTSSISRREFFSERRVGVRRRLHPGVKDERGTDPRLRNG